MAKDERSISRADFDGAFRGMNLIDGQLRWQWTESSATIQRRDNKIKILDYDLLLRMKHWLLVIL